jgi:uncharacterized protein YdbL (DUF1318 family)
MNKHIVALLVLFLAFPAFLPIVSAQDGATIKQNMIKRQPAIAALKKQGIVGEDNRGYLAVVSGQLSASDRSVVDAENADRKTVYHAIAQKTGANAEQVGKQRAKRLAEQASSGEFVMDDSGAWKKK